MLRITLVHASAELLDTTSPSLRRLATTFLQKKGIDVICNDKVLSFEEGKVRSPLCSMYLYSAFTLELLPRLHSTMAARSRRTCTFLVTRKDQILPFCLIRTLMLVDT